MLYKDNLGAEKATNWGKNKAFRRLLPNTGGKVSRVPIISGTGEGTSRQI